MSIRRALSAVRVLPAVLVTLGCATSGRPAGGQPVGRYPVTRADVDFVTGMISHHAQAIVMANFAPERTTTRAIRVLCARIINAQTDEIHIFQQWLADHGQPVPEARPMPTKMTMDGVEHEMMMPGMLTDEQMKTLEQSSGVGFDRNFLAFMIQHHQGAITMVDQLLGSPGAAQDEMIFKFASDIHADQTAEIERMQLMLSTFPEG
jgi:uncharacterized protein (DUF305 family)